MAEQREAFEAWVSRKPVCTKYNGKLTQRRDGSYADYRINDRWVAWQAALSHAEGEAGWRSGYPEYDGDGGVCHIPLDGHPDFMVVAFNRDGGLVDSCGDDVGYSLEDVERWRPIDAHPAPQVAVPEGYALVPVEPTARMMSAAKDAECDHSEAEDWLYFNGKDVIERYKAMLAAAPTAPAGEKHPDDTAVDRFAAAMKAKLAKKRAEGRSGWDDKERCSQEFLSRLLRNHVGKGDPVDVANLAMMLHQRGEVIQQPVSDPDGRLTVKRALDAVWEEFEFEFDPVFLEAMEGAGLIEQADGFLLSMKVAFEDALAQAAKSAPDEREIAARPGYAGVTVWVGDQECTQVVDRALLETSRADELLRHFENARHLLRAGKEGEPS